MVDKERGWIEDFCPEDHLKFLVSFYEKFDS